MLIIPFIIGLFDDLIHLTPLAKLIAQIVTGTLIFFFLDIRLHSTYGLVSDVQFPTAVSYLVTLMTVIIITNSLNLIDGIDGLAAVFSLIAVLFFGTWFLFVSNYQSAIICLALCGALFAFLFQNWEPSKIFMGDTGSLVIGTLLSIIGIQFINQNFALSPDNPLRFNSSIGTAICVVILPLVDTTRIILIRLHKRISPFQADKRHIHHALVRLNLSHKQAVYILTFIHVAIVGLAIFMRRMEQWQLIAVVFAVATVLCLILDRLIIKAVQKESPSKDSL